MIKFFKVLYKRYQTKKRNVRITKMKESFQALFTVCSPRLYSEKSLDTILLDKELIREPYIKPERITKTSKLTKKQKKTVSPEIALKTEADKALDEITMSPVEIKEFLDKYQLNGPAKMNTTRQNIYKRLMFIVRFPKKIKNAVTNMWAKFYASNATPEEIKDVAEDMLFKHTSKEYIDSVCKNLENSDQMAKVKTFSV